MIELFGESYKPRLPAPFISPLRSVYFLMNEGVRMAIWRTILGTGVLILGVLVLQSCAASEGTAEADGGVATVQSQVSERAREKALQHFIDGSIHEMKGNYAQAIIEYQDALRYDPNHAVFFALSKCYSRLSKHALAIESGTQAVSKAPDNVDYLRNLGDAYAGAYQIDSAAAVYERVVALDPDDIQSWYTLAGLYQGRRPLKALETYEGIIEQFGDEWEVLLQIADLSNAMGEPAKAAAALERMVTIDPGNVGLMRSLAQTYVRAQDYDSAIRIYADLRERDPENLDFLGEIATVHLLRREYLRAAELFDLVLERDSVSIEAKLQIGEAFFSQVQGDSTLLPVTRSMFRTIRNSNPDDWRPYWFLGALGGMEGNDSLTMVNFRRVTELAPWNPDGWVYLSSVYLQNGDFASVVPILEEARTHVVDDYQVNLYLGIAYTNLGRSIDAIYVLEEACNINPQDLRAVSQLGLVYDTEKRYDQLDSLYTRALEVEPENDLILNNFGYTLAERGIELERALEMSTKALAAQPKNASYLDTMGWVLFQLGEYADAERYIKEAVEIGDPSAVVHEHLGDIYYMRGKIDLALEQWKIALDLDRDNEALQQKIARKGL